MENSPGLYEIRCSAAGWTTLSGGQLDPPLTYPPEYTLDALIGHVGYLAQADGGELYVFNADDELIQTRKFKAGVRPNENALVAGLRDGTLQV